MKYKMTCVMLVISLLFQVSASNTTSLAKLNKSKKPTISLQNVSTGRVVLGVGRKYQLSTKASVGKLTYRSKNKKIVSISKKGKIKGIKTGSTSVVITATNGKRKTTKTIKIKVIKKSNFVKQKSISLVVDKDIIIGYNYLVKININPENSSDKNFSYKTNNTNILKISSKGVITPQKVGKCKITVTSGENKDVRNSVTVTVRKPSAYEVDSDGDGYSDYVEENYMGTDPKKKNGDATKLENKKVYSDNATIIPSRILAESQENDYSEESVKLSLTEKYNLTVGDIAVVEPCESYPSGISLKIETIKYEETDNIYIIEGKKPEIYEVVSYFNFHESLTPDFDSIICEEGVEVEVTDNPVSLNEIDTFSKTKKAKKERKIRFTIGKRVDDYIDKSEDDWGIEDKWHGQVVGFAEISIDDVIFFGQMLPKFLWSKEAKKNAEVTGSEIKDLNVEVKGDAKFGIELSGGRSTKIPLAVVPIWGVMGEGVYFKITLNLSHDGTASISYDVDYDVKSVYSRGSGWKVSPKFENGKIDGELKIKAKIGLDSKFAVELFGKELVSVGFELPFQAKAQVNIYSEEPNECIDVAVWLGAEVYAEFLGDIKSIEAKVKYKIWDEDTSVLHLYLHWEDGTLVNECTHKKQKDDSKENTDSENADELANSNIPEGAKSVHLKEGDSYKFTALENIHLYSEGVALVDGWQAGYCSLADYCVLNYTPMSAGDIKEIYVRSGEVDVWSEGDFIAEPVNYKPVDFIVLSKGETCIIKNYDKKKGFRVFWDGYYKKDGGFYSGWAPIAENGKVFGDDERTIESMDGVTILYMHHTEIDSADFLCAPNTVQEISYVTDTFAVSPESLKLSIGETFKITIQNNIPDYTPNIILRSINGRIKVSDDGTIERIENGADKIVIRDKRYGFFRVVEVK